MQSNSTLADVLAPIRTPDRDPALHYRRVSLVLPVEASAALDVLAGASGRGRRGEAVALLVAAIDRETQACVAATQPHDPGVPRSVEARRRAAPTIERKADARRRSQR